MHILVTKMIRRESLSFFTPSRSITQYVRVSVRVHLHVHICEILECTEWQVKKIVHYCESVRTHLMHPIPMIAFTIVFCPKRKKRVTFLIYYYILDEFITSHGILHTSCYSRVTPTQFTHTHTHTNSAWSMSH